MTKRKMLQPIPTRSKAIAARGLRRVRHDSPAEAWPPLAEWTARQQARDALKYRRLGVEVKQFAGNGVRLSQARAVLGSDLFAEFRVIRAPGRVIWCNFDLARKLGFEVPRSNELSPELHAQLIDALSFRAVQPKDDIRGQQTTRMYADRYGGEGVSPALGAGRAGDRAGGRRRGDRERDHGIPEHRHFAISFHGLAGLRGDDFLWPGGFAFD